MYLGWLYTGNLNFSETAEQKPLPAYDSNMSSAAYCEANEQIIDAYVLGDMLQDTHFCNAIVDEFIQLAEGAARLPCPQTLNPLWAKLPQ